MVDKNDKCNILHFVSNKCQRVARGVMTAEIHALLFGFNFPFILKDLVGKLMGVKMRIEAKIDSISDLTVIAKDGKMAEGD